MWHGHLACAGWKPAPQIKSIAIFRCKGAKVDNFLFDAIAHSLAKI